jgi:hypothetical protein
MHLDAYCSCLSFVTLIYTLHRPSPPAIVQRHLSTLYYVSPQLSNYLWLSSYLYFFCNALIKTDYTVQVDQPLEDALHVCYLPNWDTASGNLGLFELRSSIDGDHQKESPLAFPRLSWADLQEHCDTVCQALPDKAGHFAYQEDKETADDEISERKEVDIADFGLGFKAATMMFEPSNLLFISTATIDRNTYSSYSPQRHSSLCWLAS